MTWLSKESTRRWNSITWKWETEVLIYNYKDVYIKGEKLEATLQKEVNQMKKIRNVELEEKEEKTLQLEKDKKRQIILVEKEKDWEVSLELEKMRLVYEERLNM